MTAEGGWTAADPDRAAALTLLPPRDRARVAALHALAFEAARAARASAEPMLNEIRLQWWIDAVVRLPASDGLHPVLAAVASAWGPDAAGLAALVEGHRPACDPAALAARDDALAWIDATAGELAWRGAAALGAGAGAEAAARAQGRALGVVGALRDGVPGAAAWREAGRLAAARAADGAGTVPRAAAPVLFPGADRMRALADGRPPTEFARRAARLRFALTRDWRFSLPR